MSSEVDVYNRINKITATILSNVCDVFTGSSIYIMNVYLSNSLEKAVIIFYVLDKLIITISLENASNFSGVVVNILYEGIGSTKENLLLIYKAC